MAGFQKSFRWTAKPTLAWILYDIASSGYALLIPSVAYAVYFRQAVCGGGAYCDTQWAVLTSLAFIVAGVLSPLVGAIADIGPLRHRLFIVTTLLCCSTTIALFWVQPGAVLWGGLAFFLAQAGYILSMSLYDGYLPSVAPRQQLDRLSSVGWGLGYLGGVACFFLAYRWMAGGLTPTNLPTYRLTFLLTAIFYLLMALPAFVWLPRPAPAASPLQLGQPIATAYRQVTTTVKNWRSLPNVFKFLAGYYLISDGIVTIISFTPIFMHTQFGLSVAQILQLTLLFNGIAIPATIGMGLLSDRLSFHTLLKGVIAIWMVTLLLLTLSTEAWVPIAIAVLLGLVVGSTQSLCRGVYAQLIPQAHAGEMFGFHALVSKVSATLGPLTYGLISGATGNQRLAMLTMMLFFISGAGVLMRVPLPTKSVESG